MERRRFHLFNLEPTRIPKTLTELHEDEEALPEPEEKKQAPAKQVQTNK